MGHDENRRQRSREGQINAVPTLWSKENTKSQPAATKMEGIAKLLATYSLKP